MEKSFFRKGPPIRYDSLHSCLRAVRTLAETLGASVHMPRIGCGLAGGEWSRVEPLVASELTDGGIPVTVYDFD